MTQVYNSTNTYLLTLIIYALQQLCICKILHIFLIFHSFNFYFMHISTSRSRKFYDSLHTYLLAHKIYLLHQRFTCRPTMLRIFLIYSHHQFLIFTYFNISIAQFYSFTYTYLFTHIISTIQQLSLVQSCTYFSFLQAFESYFLHFFIKSVVKFFNSYAAYLLTQIISAHHNLYTRAYFPFSHFFNLSSLTSYISFFNISVAQFYNSYDAYSSNCCS
jgi:hypothetical protein